jgi:hypothetical protein
MNFHGLNSDVPCAKSNSTLYFIYEPFLHQVFMNFHGLNSDVPCAKSNSTLYFIYEPFLHEEPNKKKQRRHCSCPTTLS